VIVAVCATPAAAAGSFGDTTGVADESQYIRFHVLKSDQEKLANDALDPAARLIEYLSAYPCGVDAEGISPSDTPCGPRNDPLLPPDCGRAEPVRPLWYRTRQPGSAVWSDWQMAYGWTCPADHLPQLTAEDFQRLEIAAPALTVQPNRGWVLVNKETIVYSDDATQTLHTALLGHPVTVRATPTSWHWDYGDGHTATTKSPGRPYPDQTVWHTYTALGTRHVTLTVTWSGSYSYDETPGWRPVDGTATTTATSPDFTVEERRSYLVAQTCDQDPHAPGC
jgi:hypothetical protein